MIQKRNNKLAPSALAIATALGSSLFFAQVHAADVELSGVVEVEAGLTKAEDNTESDAALATVEIGIDGTVAEGVDVHVLLLHEEDDTALEIDEGTITLSNLVGPLNLTAGQMYVPFGNFESNMISDPLTLEVGETRESVLSLGYDAHGVYGSLFMFNGNSESSNDNSSDFGLNVGYTTDTFDVGFSYISKFAETDTMEGTLTSVDDNSPAAFGVHAIVNMGSIQIIGEYISAAGEFDTVELAFDGEGATPSAYNAEVGFTTVLMGKETTIAASYQGTMQAAGIELAENRMILGVSSALNENTSLSLEFMNESDVEGGSGDAINIVTAQIAVGF